MRPIAMVMLPCPDATLASAARRSIVLNGVKANRADLAVALAVRPTGSGVRPGRRSSPTGCTRVLTPEG